jgi:hypothetical protein
LVALRARDRGPASRHLQLEAVRTVGILGALAPSKLDALRRGGTPFALAWRADGSGAGGLSGSDGSDGSSGGGGGYSDGGESDDEADEDGGIGPNYAGGDSWSGQLALGLAAGEGWARHPPGLPQLPADAFAGAAAAATRPRAATGQDDAAANDAAADALAMPVPSNGELEPLEAYYPRVSLTALVKLLRRSQEVQYAIKATMHICGCFDQPLLDVYLAPVVCGYIDAIRRTDLADDTVTRARTRFGLRFTS